MGHFHRKNDGIIELHNKMSLLHTNDLTLRETETPMPRLSSVAVGLFVCVLLYFLVGFSPFSREDNGPIIDNLVGSANVISTASGSATNQIVWTSFLLVACLILYFNPLRAKKLIAKSLPLLVLVLFCGISVTWSPVVGVGGRRFTLLLFTLIVVAGITVGLTSSHTFHRVVVLVSGTVMLVNLLSVFLLPGLAKDLNGQFIGMYPHKNNAGVVAMVTFLIWISAARWTNRGRQRTLLFLGAGLWLAFLMGTGAKTSTAVAIIVPILVIALEKCVQRPSLGIPLGLLCLFMLCVMSFTVLLLNYSFDDVISLLLFENTTLTGRTNLWEFMLLEIGKRPLLGIGYGSFWGSGSESPSVSSEAFYRFGGFIGRIHQGHNGYLDIIATLGFVGFVLFLFVLIYVLAKSIKIFARPYPSKMDRQTVDLCLLITFSVVISNITDSSFLRLNILWTFFVFSYFIISSGLLNSRSNIAGLD